VICTDLSILVGEVMILDERLSRPIAFSETCLPLTHLVLVILY
jgi:hypothetical protein